MIPMTLLLICVANAEVSKPKLAVLPMQLDPSAEGKVPDIVDDYLLTAVQQVGVYEVIGPEDVKALVDFEAQKDLAGCDDATCFADIGGALGVSNLAVFKAAVLETDWVVTAKLIDIEKTQVVRRTNEFLSGADAKALLRGLPLVARKLLGKEDPAAMQQTTTTTPQAQQSPQQGQAQQSSAIEFLRPKDRKKYEAYRKKTPNALPVEAWVSMRNKESNWMFAAEMATLGGIVLFPMVGVSTGENVVMPMLFAACLLGLPTLLIIDGIDIGEIQYMPAPMRMQAQMEAIEPQRRVGVGWVFAW